MAVLRMIAGAAIKIKDGVRSVARWRLSKMKRAIDIFVKASGSLDLYFVPFQPTDHSNAIACTCS